MASIKLIGGFAQTLTLCQVTDAGINVDDNDGVDDPDVDDPDDDDDDDDVERDLFNGI